MLAKSISAILLVFSIAACGRLGVDLSGAQLARAGSAGGQAGDGAVPTPADGGQLDGGMPNDASNELDGSSQLDGSSMADAANMDAAQSADAAAACDLTGTWAGKLDVAVSWSGSLIASGNDTVSAWLVLQLVQNGTALQLSLVPCDIKFPDFSLNPAVAAETYGVSFPLTLFDHVPAYLTSTTTSAAISGAAPGGSVSIPLFGVMVGATLTNPASDAWPDVASVMSVDSDMDTKPAITANHKSGTIYTYPPVDMQRNARADLAYIAARLRFGADLTISSCDALNGNASVSSLDTHVVGCHVSGGADCDTTQRDFIDQMRPSYTPGSATLQLQRLSAGATCAGVRAALPGD